MAPNVRRVITANDENGRAAVWIDDFATNARKPRDGVTSLLLWSTDSTPADTSGNEDLGLREVIGAPPHRGTAFRVIELLPGNGYYMHVTPTIDYAVIMSGEIDMELDDGVEVHLKQGDVVVQQATVHAWINRETEPCNIAFILIDATP